MDATDDWRSLLNFKYAEPEYQALFSGDKKPMAPPPPPLPSSGSVKRSVDGSSVRSEVFRVDDILDDGRPLYEKYPAIRFPPLPQPVIPDALDGSKYGFDLDGILSTISVAPEDTDILASIHFLRAVLANLVAKAVELRQSIIEHSSYIRQLKQPVAQEDTDYIESTIFLNYVSMKDELQEIADELSLLKPWKVRHLFIEELDEDALIEAAGGINNSSTIIHLLAESYGAGHRFMDLEKAIVIAGQALQDEITRSVIAVSQLHDYTASMVRYPPGPYAKAAGVHVRWEGLNELYEKVVAPRSVLSQDFERYMLNKQLPVTNNLFAYLQHPDEYGHMLVFNNYRFAPGEFVGMLEWLEVQDEQCLSAATVHATSSSSETKVPFASDIPIPTGGKVLLDPEDSILRHLRVVVCQHCSLTDRDIHRFAQVLPRLPRLAIINFCHNLLSQSAIASIAAVVMQYPRCLQNLQLWYLDHNRINSEGAQHLCQIIHPHCPRLLKLSLNSNPIGDKGAYRVLQTLLNPQRCSFAHFPALGKSVHKSQRRFRHGRNNKQHEGEEEEEEEEVLMTLDTPARRGSQMSHSNRASKPRGSATAAGAVRFRGSILFGESFTHNLTNISIGNGGNSSEEVQQAVQSQRRYPLTSYISDYFAPTLVLETLRSLLAAAEYDIQHGGDGKATLRQHHYLFQQNNTNNAKVEETHLNKATISYDWVNDPDTEEFVMDIASDYSSEDSETEYQRRVATAVARVQKLRGVVAQTGLDTIDAGSVAERGSVSLSEAGYRAVPQRTLERIQARVQRSRDRKNRRARLTYRERLVLREKRALGMHKTRRALREQQEGAMDEDFEVDSKDEDDDLLEESSEEENADYHESDEEEGADESGFDGGFDHASKNSAANEDGNDDDDERTQVLDYTNDNANQPRGSSVHGSVRRSSTASQMTTTRTVATRSRPLLSTSLLLVRAKQSKVFDKYPRLVQSVLRLRLRLAAVSMFLALRRRTNLPYLASLSLAQCRLTAAIIPALTVVLREDNCLLAVDVSHNAGLLSRQEDCMLLASALRYTFRMKRDPFNYHHYHASASHHQRSQSPSQTQTQMQTQMQTQTHIQTTETQFHAASVQHLSLNHVDITDAGLVALSPAWSMTSSPLVRIELRGNRFGPTAANVLANLCQRGHFYLGSAAIVRQASRDPAGARASGQSNKQGDFELHKVKPPVFSAEDDDFYRDEGFLADDALLESQQASKKKGTTKRAPSPKNEEEAKSNERRRSRRHRRESLALGAGYDTHSDNIMRLVDDDEDSLDSFQDRDDFYSDEEDEDFDDYGDDEDDLGYDDDA